MEPQVRNPDRFLPDNGIEFGCLARNGTNGIPIAHNG